MGRKRKKKTEDENVQNDVTGSGSDPDSDAKRMTKKDRDTAKRLMDDVREFERLTSQSGWARIVKFAQLKKKHAQAALIDPDQTKKTTQLITYQQNIRATEDILRLPKEAVDALNEFVEMNSLFAGAVTIEATFDPETFTVNTKPKK